MNSSPLESSIPSNNPPVKKLGAGWVVGLIFVLVFGYTVYKLFWPEHVRDQLIATGVAADAVILNADPTGSTYNSQPEVRLRLRVIPVDGQPYEAETVMVINAIYTPQFQPGKSVKVRYDKNDPSKVAVEETENGQK